MHFVLFPIYLDLRELIIFVNELRVHHPVARNSLKPVSTLVITFVHITVVNINIEGLFRTYAQDLSPLSLSGVTDIGSVFGRYSGSGKDALITRSWDMMPDDLRDYSARVWVE